jgi:hypothetical protein
MPRDKDGWKRGVGAYSGDYAKFDRPEDYNRKSVRAKIQQVDKDEPTGVVSKGGPPRYAPKNKAPGALTNGRKGR